MNKAVIIGIVIFVCLLLVGLGVGIYYYNKSGTPADTTPPPPPTNTTPPTGTSSSVPTAPINSPPASGSTLTSPGTLTAGGQKLTSPSGNYTAVMQTDGNLVVYGPANSVPWALNKGPNVQYISGSTANLQSDGNFVVIGPGASTVWSSGTSRKGTGPYTLTMQDDGKLVIYDSNKSSIWST